MTTHSGSEDTANAGLTVPLAAIWGVAAAVVAVAIGELTAALSIPRAAPLSAVGDVVIGAAPRSVVEWAKQTLGTWDKPLLQVGTLVILAICAALIAIVARRNMIYGWIGLAGFSLLGVAAALSLADRSYLSVVPSLAGGAVAAIVLWWLPRFSTADHSTMDPDSFNRRRFLITASGMIAAAGIVAWTSRKFAQTSRISRARNKITLPAAKDPAIPLPHDAKLDVRGLGPWHTKNADFYRIDTALTTPSVDPDDYKLRIFGRVAQELSLSYQDLLAKPLIERDITLCCVSNEVGGDLVGNARWLGVRLADLLDEADPHPSADQLVARSVDGWTAGSPTKLCHDGRDAMLAIGMNGEPLPVAHGFPVRMIVPGLYGYVSATKWLTELELTSFSDFDAYWIRLGWSTPKPIKTQSRIDVPRGNATAGKVAVAGVAWAQHVGIGAVEVRIDDGEWHEAHLSSVASSDTWRQWMWEWDAEPGDHTVTVRATDKEGATQTEAESATTPDGATGWHSVSVSVA